MSVEFVEELPQDEGTSKTDHHAVARRLRSRSDRSYGLVSEHTKRSGATQGAKRINDGFHEAYPDGEFEAVAVTTDGKHCVFAREVRED